MEILPLGTGEAVERTKRPRKSRKKLYIFLAITVSLAALCWIAFELRQFKGDVEEVMTALNIFTDTLVQRDFESAYQITSPPFRERIGYSAFVAEQTNLAEKMGRLKSAKQTDWYLDSIDDAKTAIVKVNLQFERGSVNFQFVLHKEIGIWRVFSYEEPGR